MFENNAKSQNTIVKFDGTGRFVEISQAFGIQKIKFAFRMYDDKKEKGNRITREINCYMDVDEAVVLADRCISRDLFTMAKAREAVRAKGNYKYAKPAYELYSGTTKNGVVSRHLAISMKNPADPIAKKLPFSIMVEELPGIVTDTGAILPDKRRENEASYIAVGLTASDIVKLGLQLQRAYQIYDSWVANDTLESHVARLAKPPKPQEQFNRTYSEQAGGAYYNSNIVPPVANKNYQNRRYSDAVYG